MLPEHLKNNILHHAYLLEGSAEENLPEVLRTLRDLGIRTSSNPDFCHITLDTFKIEDARNLKAHALEKSVTGGKRIFLVVANNFLLEAQNSLLKVLEEPIPDTHFFMIVPQVNALLKTFVSRFYVVSGRWAVDSTKEKFKDAERFLKMRFSDRLEFIKTLLKEDDEDSLQEKQEEFQKDSPRSKSINFVNSLESILYDQAMLTVVAPNSGIDFEQFFKVREFLREPGSSAKSLMEALALSIPIFKINTKVLK